MALVSGTANAPILPAGWVPVNYSGADHIFRDTTVENWDYNYDPAVKKWANARDQRGNLWVWIPRFTYRAIDFNDDPEIKIRFSNGIEDDTTPIDGRECKVHPAFNFGGIELKGFWVAKYMASREYLEDGTEIPAFKPNKNAWNRITISDAFDKCIQLKEHITGVPEDIDSHLIKNSEWGAVAILAYAVGNGRPQINGQAYGVTGYVTDEQNTSGELDLQGASSTTGNLTGVFDMVGCLEEFVASYVNNNHENLSKYCQSLVNADVKYKDVFPVGTTDSAQGNYEASRGLTDGMLIHETSTGGSWKDNSWINWKGTPSVISHPYSQVPVFVRGLDYSRQDGGLTACWNGSGSTYTYTGFRAVVVNLTDVSYIPSDEPKQFYWDFKNYSPGEVPPDWDWDVIVPWEDVIVECVISENQTLKLTITPNGSSQLIYVDFFSLLPELQSVVDLEAVLRFKFSGSESIVTGIYLEPYGDHPKGQVGLYQNSPFVALETPNVQDYVIGSIPIQPDTWYFARIKFDGPNLSIKYWTSGEPEPDWMLSIEDPERVSDPGIVVFFGEVQLGTSAATIEWDYIGIGINGAEAPMPQEEPPTNTIPVISVDTINDQILREGSTFTISGNVYDQNSNDVVTVKYKINNGAEHVLTSATSDGVTPIQFFKQLNYSNRRLLDNNVDVVGEDLAEDVDHTLTIWAEDDKGGISEQITVTFRVIWQYSPVLTIETIDNQILEEGSSYSISGSVYDQNSGDIVTVKYRINQGSEQIISSTVSDGVTPAQFSKQLIYSNKRLFDGNTDVVGEDLAENVDHTLTIWAEDDKGGVSDPVTVTFRVIWVRQTPPVLSVIEPQNNKTLKDEDSYTISGAVTDLNVDDVVTVKFKINGGAERIIASAVSDGTSPIIFSKQLVYRNKRLWDATTDIIGSDLAENVDHTITIWAEDNKGGVSEQISRTFRVIWPVIPPPEEPTVEDAPWMTLKQIRDDVRSLIIEPSPGFRTDEEINLWINQAHQELGMLYGLERFTSIMLVPGQIFYDLPSDFLKLIGAWDHQGNSLEIAPISFGQRLSNLESNTKVMVLGKKVAIAPLPENTPYITLFYERKPKLLVNDTDVPEIPAPYHRLLVAYATMRALQKDEDFEGAAFYSQEYEAGKALIAGHKIQASKEIQLILDLVRHKILNPAEAAVMLNIPLKDKVWQRVEVEEKGMALLYAGAISKADLIKNTVFTDREEIQKRLQHKLEDFARIPGWEEAET